MGAKAKTLSYRIYPSIGIARLGNTESEYFIGPEVPGVVPEGPFKTGGEIKRQGVRFRIYEFECDEFGHETCKREIIVDDNTTIDWRVHLVNSKAAGNEFPPFQNEEQSPLRNKGYRRSPLVIDGSERSISGIDRKDEHPIEGEITFITTEGGLEASEQVELGLLETDREGRLIVVGAKGVSASPLGSRLPHFANNDGWYDNVSDGPVKATVTITGHHPVEVLGSAWVLVAPPSYAPGIDNVITWYDQARNIEALYFNRLLIDRDYEISFTDDIYPILVRTVGLQWVSQGARSGHGNDSHGDGNFLRPDLFAKLKDNSESSKDARMNVFKRLTHPNTIADDYQELSSYPTNMPLLFSGLNPTDPTKYVYCALTRYQYKIMQRWAEGDFDPDWDGDPISPDFEAIPLSDKPAALTRAALEACIGSPFYPGIEGTYIIAQKGTYESAYRISSDKTPGFLTEKMALPWQADFLACADNWWPAQRPVSVKTESGEFESFSRGINSYASMVQNWPELGFILENEDGQFIEEERGEID